MADRLPIGFLDAFHAAVVGAPLDDAPRHAYADAVEASDPDRAEFIRLQVRLSRWRRTGESNVDERTDASVRSLILRDRDGNRDRWEARIGPLVEACGFYRGFVEFVRLDAARFLATAAELYRAAPVLHLELSGVRPVVAELSGSPYLDRILSLSLLRNELDDRDVATIAASSHLGGLTWLDLGLNAVGPAGVEALAASDQLPHLGWVGLGVNPVGDPTPSHADGYDATSTAALALMARYGHRDWLDARERATWPPDRDAAGYGPRTAEPNAPRSRPPPFTALGA